ncbi:MAG: M28 family metallopeptidase [Acidobacteria bacterium]|nr:M28 family metallopeptidase [Acidobacteriota bacterium]
MNSRRVSAILAVAVAIAVAVYFLLFREAYGPAVREGISTIDAEQIAQHMRKLADDDKEGRETGSDGYLAAADYVAQQFREYGLEPAGDAGGYFQRVPFRRADIVPEEGSLALRSVRTEWVLTPYADYYLRPNLLRERVDVTASVVYVGYGVTAPEFNHDDYAGMDVRGKIILIFRGAPSSLPHNERAYYSSTRMKWQNAAERGVVGILYAYNREDMAKRPWERSVRHAREPSMGWIDEEGQVRDTHPGIRLVARLSREGLEALLLGARKTAEELLDSIDAGAPDPFDRPIIVKARTTSRHAAIESPNVVAVLPGGDPQLKNEFVVISGHLDHVGIGEPVKGDALHNGAYDNASGIAVMLEMARVFRGLEERPGRSLLFLAVTGEEKGLLGSDYFAHDPTVPIGSIVANVNLDMVMMLHPLRDVVAFGVEHSNLIRPLERAAQYMQVTVAPDPFPSEVIFVRSDQYSFVRRGVPSIFLVPGMESGDPAIDGLQSHMDWMAEYYHSPQDDMSQPFDFEAGADFTRLNLLLTHGIASEAERPAWNPGDFFGERFGSDQTGTAIGSSP